MMWLVSSYVSISLSNIRLRYPQPCVNRSALIVGVSAFMENGAY